MEPLGHISAFSDVIYGKYNPQKFVGRDWLVEHAASFRDTTDQRHLIIVGEPGSGKSAFLAYLADKWNCPRYFIRPDNIGGVTGLSSRYFLVSLGSQLYQKYGDSIFDHTPLGTTKVVTGFAGGYAKVIGEFINEVYTLPFVPQQLGDVDVKVGVASNHSQVIGRYINKVIDITLAVDELTLLHILLINPLHKLKELKPDETVTVLVDALDEGIRGNIPIVDIIPRSTDTEFPTNLRFIMTSREGDHLTRFQSEDQIFISEKTSTYRQKNIEDARLYIKNHLNSFPVVKNLTESSDDKFVEFAFQIEKNCDGNFLYLYHFFNELSQAIRDGLTDLDELGIPHGLDDIYRVFAVQKIKGEVSLSEWVETYLPILGIFAVAREPLDRTMVANFAGVQVEHVDFVIARIRQFLDISKVDGINSYQLFHMSFGEYLLDESRNRDYPLNRVACHGKIIAYYLAKQSNLAEVNWKAISDAYIFNHLGSHLVSADRMDDLYLLLTDSPNWMEAKSTKCMGYRELVSDIDLALQNFTDPTPPDQVINLITLYTVRQVINARVTCTDAELRLLVSSDRNIEALNYAYLRADPQEKISGLLAIHKAAKNENHNVTLLEDALKIAKGITNSNVRVLMGSELSIAFYKAGSSEKAIAILDEAVELCKDAQHPGLKGHMLCVIADAFSEINLDNRAVEIIERAKQYRNAYQDAGNKTALLCVLGTALAKTKQGDEAETAFNEAKKLIKTIEDDWAQSWAFLWLVTAYSSIGRFDEANKIATQIEDAELQQNGFLRILTDMAEVGNYSEARNLALRLFSPRSRVHGLYIVAAALAEAGHLREKDTILEEVDTVLRNADNLSKLRAGTRDNFDYDVSLFHTILAKGIAYGPLVNMIEEVVDDYQDDVHRDDTLRMIVTDLAEKGNLDEANEIFTMIDDTAQQAEALTAITIATIKSGDLEAVANLAENIPNDWHKAEALKGFALALAADSQFEKAQEVIDRISDDWHKAEALKGFALALAADGQFEKAQEVIDRISDDWHKAEALKGFALALAADSQFEKAQEVIDRISDDWHKAEALKGFALVLAADGQFEKAYALVKQHNVSDIQRVEILSILGLMFIKSHREDKANSIFDEAQTIAVNIKNDGKRVKALALLGQSLVKSQWNDKAKIMLEMAQETALNLHDGGERDDSIRAIASVFIETHQFDKAEKIISEITDIHNRFPSLVDLEKALAQAKQITEMKNSLTKFYQDASLLVVDLADVANALVEIGHIKQALASLGLRNLDLFFHFLQGWSSDFEKIEVGLASLIMEQALRIGGWLYQN